MYEPDYDTQDEREMAEFYQDMETQTRCYDVNCQICAIADRATEIALRSKGWSLSKAGEFCPTH